MFVVFFPCNRIAKMLRQSIRRSVRRLAHVLGHQSAIMGESSNSAGQHQPPVTVQQPVQTQQHVILSGSPVSEVSQHQQSAAAVVSSPPPPDYTTVLVEMNRNNNKVSVVDSATTGESSSSASSLSNEQSTSIECLMERAAPINVDRIGPTITALP